MHILLQYWRNSLALLHPRKLFNFFKQTSMIFTHASRTFLTNFGWLIVLDAIFFILFGDLVTKIIATQAKTQTTPSLLLILLSLVQSLVWFITAGTFFLLIRKDTVVDPKTYFKIYFIRYVQFLLFSSFIFMLGLYILLISGITKFPSMPWLVIALTKTIEYCSLFYWLNSTNRFTDVFTSLERSLNLVLYNIPIIIFLLGLIWPIDFGLCVLSNKILGINVHHLIFFNTAQQLIKSDVSFMLLSKALLIKYAVFIIEYFWISLLFVFYHRTRYEKYTLSLFEQTP